MVEPPEATESGDEPVPPGDQEPLYSLQEVAVAVERKQVTFPLLVKVQYGQAPANPSERARAACEQLYPEALGIFWEENGGIIDSVYANEFVGAVALTGSGRLFSCIWWDGFRFDTTATRTLEADINDLMVKAERYLPPDQRRSCMERLARLYSRLINSLADEYRLWTGKPPSSERKPHAAHLADLQQIRRELEDVRASYRSDGAARGVELYTRATALGAFAIVALAGLAAWLVSDADHTIWLGAAAGGAAGALFSVLQRLTSGDLTVRFEAERPWLGGVSRPIIGALSGLALYALIGGGVVPLDVPQGATGRGLFYSGVGFLAGFSERLAKDVFDTAAGSVGAQSGAGPPVADATSAPAQASRRAQRG